MQPEVWNEDEVVYFFMKKGLWLNITNKCLLNCRFNFLVPLNCVNTFYVAEGVINYTNDSL